MAFTLTVNGATHSIDTDEDTPLLYVLRDELGLNGARYGCGVGQCGACTVLSDGAPLRSCFVPAASLSGRAITTLEGLRAPDGTPHPLQRAFLAEQAGQCAYCIPGMILAAEALLREIDANFAADALPPELAAERSRLVDHVQPA